MNTYNYCVYLHRRKDNGEVYYVGSGVYRKREINFSGRSKKWTEIHKTFGTNVEVVSLGLTVKRAREIEIDYISKHSETIVNARQPSVEHTQIDVEAIKECLKYDTSSPTGLVWVESTGPRVKIGSPAGSLIFKDGKPRRTMIKVLGQNLYVSRVIYMLHYGEIESGLVIDHIDGNPHNNSIENLRAVTLHENSLNRAASSKKSHNLPNGVYFSDSGGFKRIQVTVLGKSRSFSVAKYGYDLALSNAIAWRSNTLLENEIAVTERHFKLSPAALVHIPASKLDLKYIGIRTSYAGVEQVLVSIVALKFNKSFSVKKYGREEAIRLAVLARDKALNSNNMDNAA